MAETYKREMREAEQRQDEAMKAIEADKKKIEETYQVSQEDLEKKKKPKKLKCGGTACPQCERCIVKNCGAVGEAVGAIGFAGGPPGLLTTALGGAIDAVAGSHQKCGCRLSDSNAGRTENLL
ncbi:unnamed protein product [Adineta steineri]|uniref:Uncharacterized protein n=1 Tax=Adineta steineri TaxID=433720 RepID=A0A818SGN4_9BILA|nr:unnamed protein product [Adineta steineri]CAF3667209.1 unnamed protein product [Adineta steineri]